MLSLNDFIELEEIESKIFKRIENNKGVRHLGNLIESIDFEESINQINLYCEYKNLLYNNLIEETLSKTYDYNKFKNALENKFKDKIEFLHDYKFQFPDKPNNNRCYIQANKKIINSKEFQSLLDLYGFFVSKKISDENSIGVYLEPIYFSDKSAEINKCNILWHIVSLSSNVSLEQLKKSFKDKGGLKPSKREKISKHFRRTYIWKEDQNIKDIWDYIVITKSENNFVLVKIDWKKYKEHQPNRKVEWFEDPNTRGGVWTREIIPYDYLTFYELHNKEQLQKYINDI